jgi:hypothetical protein
MFLIDLCFCFVIVTLLARLHCLLVPHAIPLPLPRHNWLKLVANWEYIIGRPPYDEYVKYKKSDRILSMNCKIWKWFDTNDMIWKYDHVGWHYGQWEYMRYIEFKISNNQNLNYPNLNNQNLKGLSLISCWWPTDASLPRRPSTHIPGCSASCSLASSKKEKLPRHTTTKARRSTYPWPTASRPRMLNRGRMK